MGKKSVLVTGAGSGIGRATALKFLSEGWNVILVGRRLEPLEEVAKTASDRACALSCDVGDPQSLERLARALLDPSAADPKAAPKLRALGLPDTLYAIVNNAGAYRRGTTLDAADASWEEQWRVNLMGPVRLARALAPVLMRNKGGAIVNVSSTVALRPVAGTPAYAASKAALNMWSQVLALELAPHRIRVNVVCPGIVDTPIHPFHAPQTPEDAETLKQVQSMQPLGRIGRPEEIAEAIHYFASDASAWTTGSLLPVDGGISLL